MRNTRHLDCAKDGDDKGVAWMSDTQEESLVKKGDIWPSTSGQYGYCLAPTNQQWARSHLF